MHDSDEEDEKLSNYYGVFPGIVGVLFAAGVVWFMFALADGFS